MVTKPPFTVSDAGNKFVSFICCQQVHIGRLTLKYKQAIQIKKHLPASVIVNWIFIEVFNISVWCLLLKYTILFALQGQLYACTLLFMHCETTSIHMYTGLWCGNEGVEVGTPPLETKKALKTAFQKQTENKFSTV